MYVGSRRLPRHVVLVTGPVDAAGDAVRCYEPAAGRVVRLERAAFAAGRCGLAGLGPGLVHRRPRAHSAASAAYPGLITPSMIASRSSKGRNADFIALIVNHRRSSRP